MRIACATIGLKWAGSAVLAWAGVALGWAALLRPQRAAALPAALPLAIGFGGMLAGGLFDLATADPILWGPMCASPTGTGLVQALSQHFKTMPGMHLGMLLGGLIAVPDAARARPLQRRRLIIAYGRYVGCSAFMLVGMTLAALWLPKETEAGAWPGTLGVMCIGMTGGMVAGVGLCGVLTTLCRKANA